jgi:hypothetical protein
MDKQLQRLIDLSAKTGDRLVVFDPNRPNDAYVIMPIGDYENLAVGRSEVRGLTEDELLDKINRDIAIWRSEKADEKELERPRLSFFDDVESEEAGEDEDEAADDWFRIGEALEANLNKSGFKSDRDKKTGAWRIPSERKEKAEEIIEEDRFYLENIED